MKKNKKEVVIVDHPVIKAQLSIIRDKQTRSQLFASCINCISSHLASVASNDLPTRKKEIITPITKTIGLKINGPVVLVPILRAGLGMVEGFKAMLPISSVGHIGLYRDEKSLVPIQYFCKLPDKINEATVIILDPMLATGNSAIKAIELVLKYKPKVIKFVCIVACPEGIKNLQNKCPDVQIYCASVDEKLNVNGYIVPGLGDAGDRIYGTKE